MFSLLALRPAAAVADPPTTAASPQPTSAPAAAADAPRPAWLRLDRLDAYLETEVELDRQRVQYDERRPFRQENEDIRVAEKLGTQFAGSLIDPRLFAFGADVAFGLTQEWYREKAPGADQRDYHNGYLLDYDARANILPGGPLSCTVYGQHRYDRIGRAFLPTLREERTAFGTTWNLAHDRFPVELSYDWVEIDRWGYDDPLEREESIENTLRYGAQWLISDHHRFKFTYEHAEPREQYLGLDEETFATTRDLFILEHELEFGPRHQHSLRTLVHWQEETGDWARDLLEIGPQLTLRHSDSLQTMYKYQFNRELYEGLEIESQRADFQLVHQAYRNLTTTVNLFGLNEDVENDVETSQYGGSVDWQYNRANPYGHLYANLAFAYDTQHSRGQAGDRVARDESAAFRDPLPIILRNQDVLPGSIVVTDTTNRRFFVAPADFIILRRGTYTLLYRNPTGRIADGDTVLIDYRYRVATGGQTDTLRADFGLEQRFKNGLTPYYRFAFRNQENEHTTGYPFRADRTDHHRLGLKYEQKRYNLGTELELYDDAVEPYRAVHANALWHVLDRHDHRVDASARWSHFRFPGGIDRRTVELLDTSLDHRWRLARDLSAFERLRYRWEDDSVDGTTNGWDASAGLEFLFGDLTFELSLEYDRLELPGSTDQDFVLWFRLRRDFPNVLGLK